MNKQLFDDYETENGKPWEPTRGEQQPMMSAWDIAKVAGILLAIAGIVAAVWGG